MRNLPQMNTIIYMVQVVQVVKNPPANAGDARDTGSIPGSGRSPEGMATHSSILAWRIPWTEEPGGLQSSGSQRVGHDWACMQRPSSSFGRQIRLQGSYQNHDSLASPPPPCQSPPITHLITNFSSTKLTWMWGGRGNLFLSGVKQRGAGDVSFSLRGGPFVQRCPSNVNHYWSSESKPTEDNDPGSILTNAHGHKAWGHFQNSIPP